MELDDDGCYRALRAHDARFDGVFFVGVRTTGIYCRPICPARPVARASCCFFSSAAAAEREGFRACFRCRPERAPGAARVDALPRLVRAAAAKIDSGYLDDRSLDDLATECGVTARHLRRAMESELGVSPVELAQTRRLALAKQLLQDTRMPVTEVAFASGFRSLRRFNAAFAERFARPPSSVRRTGRPLPARAIELTLEHRPPLDFASLLAFLRARAIPGVEAVSDERYTRSVDLGSRAHAGTLSVARASDTALRVSASIALAPRLPDIVQRVRALFDLDARPDLIAAHLAGDPSIGASVRARPGLRVPGAFDGFELAVRAVLGQQVSVRAATTLSGRLAARFGRPLAESDAADGVSVLFPRACELARAEVAELRAIGLTGARAETLSSLARAVDSGSIALAINADPDATSAKLVALPGIGPWTAAYIAMRALRWPDACPVGDLALKKALGTSSAREVDARTRAWSPWRAYGALHAWATLA